MNTNFLGLISLTLSLGSSGSDEVTVCEWLANS